MNLRAARPAISFILFLIVAMIGVKLLPEPWSTWWPLAAGVISLAIVSAVTHSRSSGD